MSHPGEHSPWSSSPASAILSQLYPSDSHTGWSGAAGAAGRGDSGSEDDNFPLFLGVDEVEGNVSPFVPTPVASIASVLDVCPLPGACHALELGSGDGRFTIAAALHPQVVQATGIELDSELVAFANAKLGHARQLLETGGHAATDLSACNFVQGDMFEILSRPVSVPDPSAECPDIATCGLVILYLLPEVEAKLADPLRRAYEAGAVVISVVFSLDLGFSLVDRIAGCYVYRQQA